MSNLESHAHVLFMERFGKMPERLEDINTKDQRLENLRFE